MASNDDRNAFWDALIQLPAVTPNVSFFTEYMKTFANISPNCGDWLVDDGNVWYITTGSQKFAKFLLEPFAELGKMLNFDHYCQLFAHLLQYDVLLLVRIHYHGPADEPVSAQDLMNFIGPKITPETHTTVMQTIDTFNRGARYGEILDLFCKTFGTGSLLLLCDHLDLELLSRLPPLSGPKVDEAFAHLRELGITEMAATLRANELATKMRDTGPRTIDE